MQQQCKTRTMAMKSQKIIVARFGMLARLFKHMLTSCTHVYKILDVNKVEV